MGVAGVARDRHLRLHVVVLRLCLCACLRLLFGLPARLGPEAECILVQRAGVTRERLVDLSVRYARCRRDDHCVAARANLGGRKRKDGADRGRR